MNIEEQFKIDILPFGVIKQDQLVYARFKMQLIPYEKDINASVSALNELFGFYNTDNWKYRIDGYPDKVSLTIMVNPAGENSDGSPLNFVYKEIKDGTDITKDIISVKTFNAESPHFGHAISNKNGSTRPIKTENDTVDHMFGFLNHMLEKNQKIKFGNTISAKQQPKGSLIEMTGNIKSDNNLQPLEADLYSQLKSAELCAINEPLVEWHRSVDPKNHNRDFRAMLAAIYEETELAERLFGLVREFRIPITELLLDKQVIDYSINYVNKQISQFDKSYKVYTAFQKVVSGTSKFYNGLKNPIISNEDKFFNVATQLVDPYKAQLTNHEKKKSNLKGISPDGIYVLAQFTNGINPFDLNDLDSISDLEKPKYEKMIGSRGFNVVVKSHHRESNTTEHKSLTRHSTRYQLNLDRFPEAKNWNITSNNLGYLEGNSRIQIENHDQLYNNILFAWRGDNLSVNKAAPTQQEEKLEQKHKQNTSKLVVQLYSQETDYLYKNVFTSKKGLISGSNPQLANGTEYSFFLRIVNGLEYTIPIAGELSAYDDYVYTLEDYLSNLSDLTKPIVISNHFDLQYTNSLGQEVSMLPLKSPVVIGKRAFNFKEKRDDHKMDQHTHLILNKYHAFDRSESRQVYPPEMKWEDFKISGYLLPYSLRNSDPNELTKRAMELDSRSLSKIPEDNECSSVNNHKIKYIADPRSHFLAVYPANAASILKLRPTLFKAYELENKYPFFKKNGKDTQSVELQVKRESEVKNSIVVKTSSNKILWKDQLPNGIYELNICSHDQESLLEISNNGNVKVQVSCIARPPKPIFDIIQPERQENDGNRKNWWWAQLKSKHLDIREHEAWKSLKYQEITKVLKLKSDGLEKLQRDRTHLLKMPLLLDEYPYDLFVEEEGSIGENGSLQTQIYNHGFDLEIDIDKNLYEICKYFEDYNILQIAFNDKDKLVATVDDTKLIVFYNGVPIHQITGAGVLSFQVQLNEEKGIPKYNLIINKNRSQSDIHNLNDNEFLSHEFSIHDVVLNKALIYNINTNPSIGLKFVNNGDYSFIANEKSPHAKEKKISLFASSPYQAYFKKEKKEFSLGCSGDVIEIKIPNNVEPLKPEVISGLLFLGKDSEDEKVQTKTTKHLVCLTLQQDFMLEGRNKLGIIVGKKREPLNPELEKIPFSDFGEDITKLDEFNPNISLIHDNLTDYIDLSEGREPVLAKYYGPESVKWYRRKNDTICYQVLECQPYYNTRVKAWQVVLTFHNFDEVETAFFKLFTLKICEGHGLEQYNDNGISVNYDKTGTILSAVSNAVEMPLYTGKTIELKQTHDGLEIGFTGPSAYKDKIIGVFLTKKALNHKSTVAHEMIGSDPHNYEIITIIEKGKTISGKFLLKQHQSKLKLPKLRGKSLVVMEFEKHTNFNHSLINENEWTARNENPLFDKQMIGLRLINANVFDI